MFIVPGVFISIITFPGIIVHELAHQFFCWLMKVPVIEVRYFQTKNPCGYVIHDPTNSPLANFIISVGPFIINTVLGVVIVFPGMVIFQAFGFGLRDSNILLILISLWIGISILAHAFPSIGDATVMVQTIMKNKDVNILVKIITAPIIGLIYLGSIGSVFWLDFIYAIGVSLLLPKLFLSMIWNIV